jgi:hypothetical protein
MPTVKDFADFSQRIFEILENPSEEVKRGVIRLLVDHMVVEEDTISSTILCRSLEMGD